MGVSESIREGLEISTLKTMDLEKNLVIGVEEHGEKV
jgi:hypothetical protein